jgi:hypothetical protein
MNSGHSLADAFRVAELSKARTLLESASIRQAKQSGVLSPVDRAQLDGLEAKLQALDNALGQHREQRRAVIDLLVEKDHIARNLGALNRELMAKYPQYGRLSDVRLIEAKAGQALLPADAVLISYLFDGDKLLVFVLSREKLMAKVLSIPHLNKIVRVYRQLLCKPPVAVARDACPPPEGQPLWQQTDGSLLIVF